MVEPPQCGAAQLHLPCRGVPPTGPEVLESVVAGVDDFEHSYHLITAGSVMVVSCLSSVGLNCLSSMGLN